MNILKKLKKYIDKIYLIHENVSWFLEQEMKVIDNTINGSNR